MRLKWQFHLFRKVYFGFIIKVKHLKLFRKASFDYFYFSSRTIQIVLKTFTHIFRYSLQTKEPFRQMLCSSESKREAKSFSATPPSSKTRPILFFYVYGSFRFTKKIKKNNRFYKNDKRFKSTQRTSFSKYPGHKKKKYSSQFATNPSSYHGFVSDAGSTRVKHFIFGFMQLICRGVRPGKLQQFVWGLWDDPRQITEANGKRFPQERKKCNHAGCRPACLQDRCVFISYS